MDVPLPSDDSDDRSGPSESDEQEDALNEEFETASDVSEEFSLCLWTPLQLPEVASVRDAFRHVNKEVVRGPEAVRQLRKALFLGDVETNRPEIPGNVVAKILDMAEYRCCVKKSCDCRFSGENMDFLFFKFGPIPGKPNKLGFRVRSHDQGWSSYPEDQGGKDNSWTYGEVDVKDGEGASKLTERERIFTNIHASSEWQTRSMTFEADERFMSQLGEGDTLEFYFRAQFPGWCLYVEQVSMALWYDPLR